MRELVELGVSWVWMGLESPHSSYAKLKGTDTLKLTRELREHGIKLLGSTIVGLEHHTPENIDGGDRARRRARYRFPPVHALHAGARHAALSRRWTEQGRMLEGVDLADIHGQDQFNFQHAAISREDSKRFLDWAFRRDFERNGPSIYRICRTTLEGWLRYKNDPDPRVRARFAWEARSLRDGYAAALWAMETPPAPAPTPRWRRRSARCASRWNASSACLSRLLGRALGPVLLWSARREERRLAAGQTYEPRTIIERRNWTWSAPLLPTPPLTVLPAIEESSAS